VGCAAQAMKVRNLGSWDRVRGLKGWMEEQQKMVDMVSGKTGWFCRRLEGSWRKGGVMKERGMEQIDILVLEGEGANQWAVQIEAYHGEG
jgi:hypothetical protein